MWLLDIRTWRNGKEYRKYEKFHGGEKAATERSFELKKKLKARAETQNSSLTFKKFSEVLQYYLERHDVKGSKPYFRRLLDDLGGVELSFFKDKFDRWFQLTRQSKGLRTGRPLASATLNRYVAWSKAALNFSLLNRMIESNPLKCWTMLKEIPKDVSLSSEDQRRLLNVIESEAPHLSAITRYALQVPCRKSELINMRRGDLDLFNNCIRVRNGVTKNDRGINKPIPPDMLEYFCNIPQESDYLFYRQDWRGKFHPLGDFKTAWRRCLRIAGFEYLTFHSTRHISATALVDNGTPEQVVMEVAGWRQNMLRIYYNRQPKKTLELVRFSPQTGNKTGYIQAAAL